MNLPQIVEIVIRRSFGGFFGALLKCFWYPISTNLKYDSPIRPAGHHPSVSVARSFPVSVVEINARLKSERNVGLNSRPDSRSGFTLKFVFQQKGVWIEISRGVRLKCVIQSNVLICSISVRPGKRGENRVKIGFGNGLE